ncbi:lipoate--protein ligase family protein [Lusitaniella coriacea LEGE 07157]|uniref:Lipoate--protein ligase family protein n=1 Tax=Lusitaniella coriacea LEGE 07157 TaxID=945747 RepID=A0A8J7JF06_9CYAN|nr:biotin/lipoate A/B protein ligase family protein [Lusitaniella coriacea]MBE9119035.1 lipoate--protein ligase family protein [Lusitaniella coriacea LEGE 07157]
MTPWRLIPLLNAPGSVQMAIDRWLLQQHRQGKQPPILRFYTWEPAAISLGYHQRRYPDFWKNLTWEDKKLEIVRRPTGGRAVLHQGDLTYAIIASGFSKTKTLAYEQICTFLLQGWRSLGVELHYGTSGRGYIRHPSCFSTATAADLVTKESYKLIGSAQLRQGTALLQHGSMRLSPNLELFERVFGEPIQAVQFPFSHKDAIPLIVETLTQAARHCFAAEFTTQPLSEAEWEAIRENQ